MRATNIILTGMMGAGKTTIGRDLAKQLHKRFVDLDEVIEKRAGTSIPELFEHYGEADFRKRESEALADILNHTNQVVATGGGVIMREDNRNLMHRDPVIWLALDSTTAAGRLVFDGTRPLLASGTGDSSVVSEIEKGMANWRYLERERRWAYSLCDWIVDAAESPAVIVDEIMAWCRRWQDTHPDHSSGKHPWKVDHLRVNVPEQPYHIHCGWGILENLGNRCRAEAGLQQVLLVSNPTVFQLYGTQAEKSLEAAKLKWDTLLIPDGEEHKHLETVELIYGAAFQAGLDRHSGIIALGGGVIGDVAGFAASTYMRGIRLVQVPTTLLAQVDSSVGGKVGVNHPNGKNLIGSFYQPALVLADLKTLQTLPRRQFLTGMAEVIKYALIGSYGLLGDLESYEHGEVSRAVLQAWVQESCKLKAKVVAADTEEAGYREILNFGHTVGHAVEKVAGYGRYTHGEAVAIGMVTATILSYLRGYLAESDFHRVVRLLRAWGLPTTIGELSVPAIITACRLDKKSRAGQMRFVLLERLGSARFGEIITEDELAQAFSIQRGGGCDEDSGN
ncbi:MAG: 3-dehydroquinate synthase [Firmicutes bacterium]|nr:3-dehydroquinate synthase [Bacillota bacterium]